MVLAPIARETAADVAPFATRAPLILTVALALLGIADTVVLALPLPTVTEYAVVAAARVIDPADSVSALNEASVVEVDVDVEGLVGDDPPHACASAAVPKRPSERTTLRRDSRLTIAAFVVRSR
jgi:hypothetical protein